MPKDDSGLVMLGLFSIVFILGIATLTYMLGGM